MIGPERDDAMHPSHPHHMDEDKAYAAKQAAERHAQRERFIQGSDPAHPHFPEDAKKANTRQVGGSHYGLSQFQHWDMVVLFDLDYFQSQITKYVMRHKKKHGIQDLEKAQHFLEKYIEVLRNKAEDIARALPEAAYDSRKHSTAAGVSDDAIDPQAGGHRA